MSRSLHALAYGTSAVLGIALTAPVHAQDPAAADSAAVDSLATESSGSTGARFPIPLVDPRITLLRDTLGPADTLRPKFTDLPEIYDTPILDPYTIDRPGAWPAWELVGDQLLGRGAFSLLDVLESEFLVQPQDLGGGGLNAFFGSELGSHTNIEVFVDGVPMRDPMSAGWDLRQIPIEAIARIAWYPGAQAAVWGGGSTGGVLSITTRRSLAPSARSMLAFTVGSFDTETFSGNFSRPIAGGGDLFIGANFDATDGFLRVGDFTRNQVVAKLGWRLGERHRLEIARMSDGLSSDANRTNVIGIQDQNARLLHLSYRGRLGPLGARAHLYRAGLDLDTNLSYRGAQGMVGEGRRNGFRVDLDWRLDDLLVWASAGREEREVESMHPSFLRLDASSIFELDEDDPSAPFIDNPQKRTEWGGGAGWGGTESPLGINAAVRTASHGDAADRGTSWQIEAVARPAAPWTFRAAAGRSVRPAGVAEQALLAALAVEGVDVHPGTPADPRGLESWTTFRGEARWADRGWSVAGRVVSASGNDAFLWLPPSAWLYFDRGDIENVRIAEAGFNTFDVVDISIDGFETEVGVPLPWDLRGRLLARRVSATEESSGDRVPYVAESQSLAQLRYARRLFPSRDLLLEARLTGRFVGERTTLSEDPLPAYSAVDLLVQGTVINFTVFVSFKNLANQLYRTEDDFFLPGREGFFGINWRFRN